MMKFEIYVCEDPWHQLIWLERGIFCWTVVDLNSSGQVMCFRGKIHSTTVQVSLTVICCVFDPLSVTCVFVCLSVTLNVLASVRRWMASILFAKESRFNFVLITGTYQKGRDKWLLYNCLKYQKQNRTNKRGKILQA